MSENQRVCSIRAALFDFGGVLAEEGFRKGLMEIGRKNGLDPTEFFRTATETTYQTGYVIGEADERQYWDAVRRATGINGLDQDLRTELLDRFVLRPTMIGLVKKLKSRGLTVSILSDQTNWLDELNQRDDFFKEFDNVFNSFHMGKAKRDPGLFMDILEAIGFSPSQTVFIDDHEGHIRRAESQGLHTILFKGEKLLFQELQNLGLKVFE
jgi:HAD superfamily hydrolase (TIGR01509 family)